MHEQKTTSLIPIGDVELPLFLIAHALGIPAATLEGAPPVWSVGGEPRGPPRVARPSEVAKGLLDRIPKLTPWEKQFLTSLADREMQHVATDKQSQWLRNIASKYGESI